MAKYSTSNTSTKQEVCQICGESDKELTTTVVSNATVTVCTACNETDSTEATDSTTPGYTITNPDSSWVDDVSYGNIDTPELVANYATVFAEALTEYDQSVLTLSGETGVPVASLRSLKNEAAEDSGLSAEEIKSIEEKLNIILLENK